MPLTRNQLIIVGIGAIIFLFLILALTGVIPVLRPATTTSNLPKVRLEFWGVFDDASAFRDAISSYERVHTNVSVNYTQKDPATYEGDLVNALAAGTGPDIIMFQNTWLPKHYNKIVPVPANQLSFASFQNDYPTVVAQDFSAQRTVYALPLYLDTLALLYNKDFFDKKAIALPPATWNEFLAMVPKLREVNQTTGEVTKAAAAIGGSATSINLQSDLLSAIFLQNGAKMTDTNGLSATFASAEGLRALQFYLQFANPGSPSYTWNDTLHYSIDNFAEGNVAMIFNYQFQLAALKQKNPFLNVGIAPIPQADPANPVTVASYWGLTVSNESRNAMTAWDFILYLTHDANVAAAYTNLTGHPPALRSLISQAVGDQNIGVFSRQALIARSWPEIDSIKIAQSFSGMVQAVLRGQLTADAALKKSQDEISALMRG